MTAVGIHTKALGSLGKGDLVQVSELAKKMAEAVVAGVVASADTTRPTGDLIEDLLQRTSGPSEDLLAVLFPLIEYGGQRGHEVASLCLARVGAETTCNSDDQNWNRRAGVLVLGRLIWASVAFSLSSNRVDAVAQLGRAGCRDYGRPTARPLVSHRSLRYPEALGSGADAAYDNYREWLLNLEFVRSASVFFASTPETGFAQADLLLALRTALVDGGTYCKSVDRDTVRQLALIIHDETNRPAFAEFFATSPSALDDVLEAAYLQVGTGRGGWSKPPTLLGDPDS